MKNVMLIGNRKFFCEKSQFNLKMEMRDEISRKINVCS